MRLRPLEPEDLSLLYTIENDPSMWNTSNAEGPYSRFQLKEYIARGDSAFSSGQQRFVAETDEDGSVGVVDLTNFTPLHARAEVGIALLAKHRGKGYAAAALRLVEAFAQKRLRVHSLYAVVTDGNDASAGLFTSLDYTLAARLPSWHFRDGDYRDALLFQKILGKK